MNKWQKAEAQGVWFFVSNDPTGDSAPRVYRRLKAAVKAANRLLNRHPFVRLEWEDMMGETHLLGVFPDFRD